MSIYDDMQAVASDVLAEFKQGTIAYVELVAPEGATPDDPGDPVPTRTEFNGVASPVSTRYVDGTDIVASDRQVVMPGVLGVTPSIEGWIEIDGKSNKIVDIKRIPEAGTVVVFIVIVRR